MRALVTGADGFVGRWLCKLLADERDDIAAAFGPSVSIEDEGGERLDIRDASAVSRLVEAVQPDAIYHLAGVAFGPDVQESPRTAVDVTITGTINVLEAASRLRPAPLVLIPSSSEVYGVSGRLNERLHAAPVNLYGATKAAQEVVALTFFRSGLVPVVVARAFNHIGPGQRSDFAVASFAAQLATVSPQSRPVVRVGNTGVVRDFTDVRDVVRAYRALVVRRFTGRPVNVCTGHGVTLETVFRKLVAISGVAAEMRVDRNRLRAADLSEVVGDPSLIQKQLDWRPLIQLDTTLEDVWADACARMSSRTR